jgi:hypothetical protein
MFVFKVDEKYFCYLHNPKCGTHSFYRLKYEVILQDPDVEEIFESPEIEIDYSNYNYVHCNLHAAFTYFKEQNISIEEVVFFTTIRNPFERYKSSYWYNLSYEKTKYLFSDSSSQQEDFDRFVKENKHILQFSPTKFWCCYGVEVNDVLRIEHWCEDLNNFFKKYDLNFDASFLNNVKENVSTKAQELEISETVKKYIVSKFRLDFCKGGYSIE